LENPNLIIIIIIIIALLYIEQKKMEVIILLFTDGKQHKAHKLDMHMITLRHHAPKSYDMITGDVE